MIQPKKISRLDLAGTTASGLCACMVSAFLFLAKAYSAAYFTTKPVWWGLIDYFFIFISFFAIYYTVKNTDKEWIKFALWGIWMVLTCALVNETFEIMHLPKASVYTSALILVVLHSYNYKYGKHF